MQTNIIMRNDNTVPDMSALSAFPADNLAERGNPIGTAIDAQKLMHEAKVVGECYRIRVLFDTEHLKNDKDYIAIIEDTWLRTFKDTDLELLEEAVQNFIAADKKGYLLKPGQIVEFLVKEIKSIERRRKWANIERMERELLLREYSNDTED